MTSTQPTDVIIGVDTHKSTHVAVAITKQGARLATLSIPASSHGYVELEAWSRSLGSIDAFGIEGTGSYGAGLSRYLLSKGHKVVEVTRPYRQLRDRHGKSDSLDAEGTARSVLSGQASAEPKTQTGLVEMIRHLKVARDTAVKSRSQAMITLKTLLINAPAALRESIEHIKSTLALIRHIAALRPGPINSTTASAKAAMRALGRRWIALNEEVLEFDKNLKVLTEAAAPKLLNAHGIGTMTAAEMLIQVGDDPTRIRSEAALAKLCGVCPVPASSGKTNRFRLNRSGNRQANAALYRIAIVRMKTHEPTQVYLRKRTLEGKTKKEIIRCLKRYIVREIFNCLCRPNSVQKTI